MAAAVETGGGESRLMDKLLENSDLFGGDSDSDPDLPPVGTSAVEPERSPSPRPVKTTKKKKSQKPESLKEKKPKKLKKIEVQQIHSDSQRMVRESSLNLPKYQPKTKDLTSFLTRVRARKPMTTPAVTLMKTRPIEDHLIDAPLTDKENDTHSTLDTSPLPHPNKSPSNDIDNPITDMATPQTVEITSTHTETSDKDGVVEDLSFTEDVSPQPNSDADVCDPVKQSGTLKPSHPKQSTITSLFKTHLSSDATAESASDNPQLSSLDDFLFERDEKLTIELNFEPKRELTPLEKFQQRFTKHAVSSQSLKVKGDKGQVRDGDSTPLVSEELVAKLADKPGAIRQHLRNKLRAQVSQRRAEERKATEEVRKMYSEEINEDEDELEMMTDAETSDEEYTNVSGGEKEESDVCSDLDEDEQFNNVTTNQNAVSSRSSNQNSDEDSEDDISHIPKRTALRILDSEDDEDSTSELTTKSQNTTTQHHPAPAITTEHSVSMFEVSSNDAIRRPSVEEASMPPLMLNISSDSESNDRGSPISTMTSSIIENGGTTHTCSDTTFSSFKLTQGESTFDLPLDNGTTNVSLSVINGDSQLTLGLEGDGSADESVAPMASEDSLEMSFRWPDGPSLPPAQPNRQHSLELFKEKDKADRLGLSEETFDPQSQWEEAQALPPVATATNTQNVESHDMSVDESTQFLDADGFLCQRKENRHTSSAIKTSLDSTQPGSPSELLNLCSGEFTRTQQPMSLLRRRHPSDSSTQGVRELLGLSERPQPVGISRLLGGEQTQSTREISESNFSQINEVIGLCSGAFPITQVVSTLNQHSILNKKPFNGNTSDSSDEDVLTVQDLKTDNKDSAMLRWAEKQLQINSAEGCGYYGDSEDEDNMPLIKRRKVKLKVKQNKSERLAQFVDSEAELSGSDIGTDDEILAEEEEGLFGYGGEEGDQSDVPLSENELWDQVNKAHMKQTFADDKADLRDIKERFLKEGDLYEDGLALKNGFFRSRRFAKSGSEAGSLDLFSEGPGEVDGGEGEELSSQAEAKRRKDRLEREEFMMKCRENDGSLLAMDEDSQSILNIIVDNSSQSMTTTPLLPKQTCLTTPSFSTGCKKNRGSFLKHNSTTLRRLSSLTAATPKPAGVTSGRGFVFHKKPGSIELSSEVNRTTETKKTSKRSLSDRKEREAKKPKLDRSMSTPANTHSSIFSVLD